MTPQNRKMTLIAVLALCAAAVIWDRSGQQTNDEVVGAVVRVKTVPLNAAASSNSSSVSTAAASGNTNLASGDVVLPLVPRDDYKDDAQNVFAAVNYGAKVAQQEAEQAAKVQAAIPPPPPAPPMAPPMPFSVVGKQKSGAVWEVFLAQSQQIFVVHVGDILASNYQVISIKPPMMQLRYLPLNQDQTLMIGSSFDD